jgi:hypothetical protein
MSTKHIDLVLIAELDEAGTHIIELCEGLRALDACLRVCRGHLLKDPDYENDALLEEVKNNALQVMALWKRLISSFCVLGGGTLDE